MPHVSKRGFLVVISMAIVLGIAVIASTLLASTTSINQHSVSVQSKPRVISGDVTFAKSFKSLGELKGASTLIVLGTVTMQKVSIGSHGVPSTLSTLVIERTLKGTLTTGQTVVVKQLGGVAPDGTLWIMENFPLLKIGTRYIVFLTPSLSPDAFYPVGAPQGIFVVNTSGNVNSFTVEAAQMGVSVQNVPLDRFIQEVQAAPTIPTQP